MFYRIMDSPALSREILSFSQKRMLEVCRRSAYNEMRVRNPLTEMV